VLDHAEARAARPHQHHALPSLHERAPHPEVELRPAAAPARGIANGDWLSIETPEVRARARLNHNLDPRVVIGKHGWWQACSEIGAPGHDPFASHGANLNLIIGSTALDPVSGTASHRAYLCEIRPAAGLVSGSRSGPRSLSLPTAR